MPRRLQGWSTQQQGGFQRPGRVRSVAISQEEAAQKAKLLQEKDAKERALLGNPLGARIPETASVSCSTCRKGRTFVAFEEINYGRRDYDTRIDLLGGYSRCPHCGAKGPRYFLANLRS
jgi:hypothetical protein